MKSVTTFSKEQKKEFNHVIDDFGGPTSTAWVLTVLEDCVYSLADKPCFGDEKTANDFEVCMAALEYFRMSYCLDDGEEDGALQKD